MKGNKIRRILLLFIVFVGCVVPAKSQINTNRVLAIGKNALYFEDYVLSIQYFNQVIKSKPYLAEPYFYRAIAKLNLDDFNGAEADLTLCLERNPFLWNAYQCRGIARQNLADYERAIEDYNNGLNHRPEDKQMLLNKSIAYIQKKDYESSFQTLDTLLRYHPKYTQAYLTRGAALAEKGDTLLAFEDYNKALDLDKYYAPTYAQRGMLFFSQGDYKSALQDYDEAIRLETKQIGYHINRGLIRYYLNDLRGAMSDYDSVINWDSHNLIARFNRALLRANVGDAVGAIEDFNQVISQEPDNFMAIYNRAILNVEVQKYREAVNDLNKVLAEYPYFLQGYYFRSEVKRKMHDTKGAENDYWYAYDLEKKLQKEQEKGKVITGKEILDTSDVLADENSKVREKSDDSIEKFNRLVVYDKDEEAKSKYQNEIRGRVQDKNVKVDLEPQFIITYYERLEAIDKSTTHVDEMVTEYNAKKELNLHLKVVNKEAPLTDEQAAFHFLSIDELSLKIDRNSQDVNAYFGRALDYMVLQDLSEAIDDFTRVISLESDFTMAYFNRAVVRYKQLELHDSETVISAANMETNETKRKYEYDLILRDYERVIQLNPNFAYAYFNRANMRCAQKDYRAALVDYDKAIERNPEFAEAYLNRGLTRLSLGNKQGVDDLSKAGELGIVSAYSIIKRMTTN